MATCWEILGVVETASAEEVKQAYRKLAQVAHPDHGGSETEFVRLNIAYRAALEAASTPVICQECHGLGSVTTTFGFITVRVHCHRCGGLGSVPRT